jgi:hypothetical protein
MRAADVDRAARLEQRRRDWRERHGPVGMSGADPALVRQLAGYARRFADVAGRDLTAADVLAALNDTGLAFIRDAEGFAADAHRWAVFVIAADPLDQEPAIDTRWDREQEDREAAAMRRTRRRFEDD